ncbi:MAG: GNAT family N-acetyltransferase [Anaerolineales bacterium]|nr:GNAT family N-acetyltransferase [Anaerolineales bacterium]
MVEITLRRATDEDKAEWFKMRKGIWPDAPDDYMTFDQDDILASGDNAVFFACADGDIAGMIEASIKDSAEGCETSPVGYLEAWFVYERFRGKGVAGALISAAEDWIREKGCVEVGSDTWLENDASIRAHKKSGYSEAERLVHFVKRL